MMPRFPLKLTKIFADHPLNHTLMVGVKKLWEIFTQSSDELSKREKFNQENSANVIDYNQLLMKLTQEIEDDICKLENHITLELIEYYSELVMLIEAVEQSKNLNLESKAVRRSIERLKTSTKGMLVKGMYKQISLDNGQLRQILSLQPGELKKKRVEDFKTTVIKTTLVDSTQEIRLMLDYLSEDITEVLNGSISQLREANEAFVHNLSLLEQYKEKNTIDFANVVSVAQEKILLCNKIVEVVEE